MTRSERKQMIREQLWLELASKPPMFRENRKYRRLIARRVIARAK